MRMHSDTKTDQGEPLACPKRIDRSALGRALNSRRSREYNAKDKNSGAEAHHAVRRAKEPDQASHASEDQQEAPDAEDSPLAEGAAIGSDPAREDQQEDREKNENERIEGNDPGTLHELQYNML